MSITRRKFIGKAAIATAAVAVGGYSLWEAHDLLVRRMDLPVPRLPEGFDGIRVAFVSDIHHGPYTSLSYVRRMVDQVNEAAPEIILLGGDFPYYKAEYIPPVIEVLGALQAPMGVYAVRGNHDNLSDKSLCSSELRRNKIKEITNAGLWLKRGGSGLFLCGVDDLWTGFPNINKALAGTAPGDPALLVSHNPDFLEELRDPRVIYAFCGHTHGGQIRLPLIGSPVLPSYYGQKYAYGQVRAPAVSAYVTSGVGTIFPPVRLGCPPEIALMTLKRSI